MPKDVIITPANSYVEFRDTNSNVDAMIYLDNSRNLNIQNPNGSLTLGNTAANVYIGDGTSVVDIIFEQNGSVRALTGKTLTLGQSDSSVAFAGNVTNGFRVTSGNVGIGTTTPAASLQVVGGAIMPAAGNSATAGIQFPSDPGGGSGDRAYIRYFVRTGESMTLLLGMENDADDHIAAIPGGNFGVGLIDPSSKLHVVGNANITTSINTATVNATTINAQTFVTSTGANVYAAAVSAYGQANAAYGQANAAYTQANTATTNAGNAYGQANAAYTQANTAYGQANAAYGQANAAYTQANAAYGQANAAYGQANSAFTAANNRVLKAGDTMTGQLNISSGGLLVTGNVGIGIASPTSALHVIGSANVSANLTVGAGAVGSPSITTAGDNNTGIFFPAADTMAFTEGGSEAMRIDSSGRVTIGNTTGDALFSVYQSTDGISAARFRGPTRNMAIIPYYNSEGSDYGTWIYAYNTSGGAFNRLTIGASAETLINPTGGNVAIGTTTPTSNLHVIGSANVSANLFSATHSAVQTTAAISSGTLTLNLNNATVFEVTLNANITTLTISNPKATTRTSSFVLIFVGDGTARSITWPASFKFPDGSAPSVTSTNAKRTIFTFVSYDGGTNWYGIRSGANF